MTDMYDQCLEQLAGVIHIMHQHPKIVKRRSKERWVEQDRQRLSCHMVVFLIVRNPK